MTWSYSSGATTITRMTKTKLSSTRQRNYRCRRVSFVGGDRQEVKMADSSNASRDLPHSARQNLANSFASATTIPVTHTPHKKTFGGRVLPETDCVGAGCSSTIGTVAKQYQKIARLENNARNTYSSDCLRRGFFDKHRDKTQNMLTSRDRASSSTNMHVEEEYERATKILIEFHKRKVATLSLHSSVLDAIDESSDAENDSREDSEEITSSNDNFSGVRTITHTRSISKKKSLFDLSSLVLGEESEDTSSEGDIGSKSPHEHEETYSNNWGQFFDMPETKISSGEKLGLVSGMSYGRYQRVRTSNPRTISSILHRGGSDISHSNNKGKIRARSLRVG